MTISTANIIAVEDETAGWDNLAGFAGSWRNTFWNLASTEMRWGETFGKFPIAWERIVLKFKNITPAIPPNAVITSAVLRGTAIAISDTQSFFTVIQAMAPDGRWDLPSSGPQWVSASQANPDGVQTDADVTLLNQVGATIVDTSTPPLFRWAIRNNVAGRYTKAGQSVQSPSAFTLGFADIAIAREGTVATGNVWCEIYSLDADGLADVLLATSNTIAASAVPTVFSRVRFMFRRGNQIAIAALQNVAIVLNGDWPVSATENIGIGWNSGSYTDGSFQLFGTGVGFDDQNYPMQRNFRRIPGASALFIVWVAPRFFEGVDYDTPNLATILQPRIFGGNYSEGDPLAFAVSRSLFLFPDETALRRWAQFNHGTFPSIRLIVEWEELADASILDIDPAIGVLAGGTAVTITGTGFITPTTVTFDGILATSVVVVNDTTITCITPAHVAGAVDVIVITPFDSATKINAFTYLTDLAMAIAEFALAVATILGRTILVGGQHVHSQVTFPKLICVPFSEEVNDSNQTGGGIRAGEYEHEIGLREILCEWHVWEADLATTETTVEALYIAIRRAGVENDNQNTMLIGGRWINDAASMTSHGGSYHILTASFGVRLIDSNQVPLLTPTSQSVVAKFKDEVVC